MARDTIAAIATPLGEGGIGVVRISGPAAISITRSITRLSTGSRLKSHKVSHGWIISKAKLIDEAIITYFKAPKSYTGEDVVEISCHGGSAVLKHVLELAIKAGARVANRGEYTKRAFLNGKLDLSQAEAVIDLIRARTKETSLLAACHLMGSLSARIRGIRQAIVDLIAGIEASIDFPDELKAPDLGKAKAAVKVAIKAVDNLLNTADIGKIHREGVSVAIAGKPNVGKSSLLNALLRHDRAIVDAEPGTTRDIIEEAININGIEFKIIDTAGIRRSRNNTEKKGITRANNAFENSDLILLVIDRSRPLTSEDKKLLERIDGKRTIVVLNKSDLRHAIKPSDIKRLAACAICDVSALKEQGISRLEKAMYLEVTGHKVVAQNADVMINLRQKQCLERAREFLDNSLRTISGGMQPDFIAIDLKGAAASLGEVTGDVVSDEVIDRIFEQFCVGK